ncbi:MAG: M23 family metallopeptidase [Egibacteraceae bacterium]
MPDVAVRAMISIRAVRNRVSASRGLQKARGAEASSARRSPRLPRPAAVVLWIAAFSLGWVVTAATTQTDPVSAESRFVAAVAVLPARDWGLSNRVDGSPGDLVQQDVRQNPVFAVVRGLRLMLPHPSPRLVAFHEASKPEALRLYPAGHLVQNNNPGFTPGPDKAGPNYWVLSSRGRGRPATSAVDIVVPKGALIAAPVSGRVVEVRQYPLYGRMLDWRVAIEPAGYPGLQVVLIHLLQPRVAAGDKVVAGTTSLGAVRLLGFTSQVDYVTHQSLPHTHIEVKPVVGQ